MTQSNSNPPQSPPRSQDNSELRETILNEILIHEEECDSSLYGTSCNCVQQNVAAYLLRVFDQWANKRAEAARIDELQNHIHPAAIWYEDLGSIRNTQSVSDRIAALTSKTNKGEQASNNIDRIEVIDDTGRAYVKGSIYGTPVQVELSYQDDGRTLKVFVRRIVEGEPANENN